MSFSDRKYFDAEIDGVTLKDFRELDRTKTSLADRLEEVESKLESTSFFTEYFDKNFKVNVTGNNPLSDEDAVCLSLENMANYLLACDESKQMDKEQEEKIVIHKDRKKFLKKVNRENYSITTDGVRSNITDDDNVVHYFVNNDRNHVLPKHQAIKQSDLNRDDETGRVLREYDKFLKIINKKLLEKPDRNWFLYSRAKGQLQDDMINVKNMLDGVWGYNISSSKSPYNSFDYDIFDFTDRKTIEFLTVMQEPDFELNHEMWLVWLEFNSTVAKADFTEEEKLVLYLMQRQWTFVEIEEYLNIDYRRLTNTVQNNIYKKIERVGNKYDALDLKNKYKLLNKKHKGELDDDKI